MPRVVAVATLLRNCSTGNPSSRVSTRPVVPAANP